MPDFVFFVLRRRSVFVGVGMCHWVSGQSRALATPEQMEEAGQIFVADSDFHNDAAATVQGSGRQFQLARRDIGFAAS